MTDPVPTPKPSINWMGVIAAVLAAITGLLAGPHVIPDKDKTPPVVVVDPPKPTPPVVVIDPPKPVDPVPIPTPVPVPVPPTPVVPPSPIVTGLTIVDTKGKALGNSVPPNKQFVVSADTGVILTPLASSIDDADISQFSDNKFSCTLRNGCVLQVVVSVSGRPTIVTITCNHGPQPPPDPVVVVPPRPVPVPTPIPTPTPVPDQLTGKIRVLVLVDAKQNLSRDQINAIDSPVVVGMLNEKCVKDSVNRPAWRKWDTELKPETIPEPWKKLMSASLEEVASRSLKLPVLCIENGTKLTLCEITNEASVLTPLTAAFGG